MNPDDFTPLNMPDIDFSKFQIQPQIPQSVLNIERENQRMLDEIDEAHREREQEANRKHEEIVGAINQLNETMKETVVEAIKMGANVTIDSNTGVINISQNSQNVQMQGTVSSECDYDAVEKTLSEIKGYLELPQFNNDFGENSELVKKTVEETLVAAREKKSPKIIQEGLKTLRSVAEGVAGSFIASGIVGMVDKIPLFFV